MKGLLLILGLILGVAGIVQMVQAHLIANAIISNDLLQWAPSRVSSHFSASKEVGTRREAKRVRSLHGFIFQLLKYGPLA